MFYKITVGHPSRSVGHPSRSVLYCSQSVMFDLRPENDKGARHGCLVMFWLLSDTTDLILFVESRDGGDLGFLYLNAGSLNGLPPACRARI